jgi:hypothetical protein
MRVFTDLDLNGADAWWQALASALGLMNPAKIVWNAIPFSFAVDWFVNVAGWLNDNAEIQPFEGKITIEGADFSCKVRKFYGHWHPTNIDWFGNITSGKFADSLVRGFYRRHGTPERTIVSDGLTPYQQTLAAALVSSNSGRRGMRRR